MKRSPLTGRQLFWLTFLMMFPTIILLLPGDLLRIGGRYAWWTPLVAAAPSVPLLWAVGAAAKRYGSLSGVACAAFGRVGGRLLLLAACAAVGAYVVFITREFATLAAATFVYQDVPVPVLTVLGLTLAGFAAWLGLTVVARGAEIMGPLLLGVHLLASATALLFAHVSWALPLLPRNARFAELGALARTWIWFAEPLLATLMIDHVAEDARGSAGRILAAAVATAAIVTAFGLWTLVAVFGPVRAAQLQLPFFDLARDLTFGGYVEQILELMLIPTVVMGAASKVAIFYWLWARSAEAATGVKRGLWLPVGLLGLGVVSVIAFGNVLALDRALYRVLAVFALPVLAGSIVVPYAVSAARRRGA